MVAPIFIEWMKPFHDLDVKTLSKFSNTGSDQVNFDKAGTARLSVSSRPNRLLDRRWHYNMDFYDHIIPTGSENKRRRTGELCLSRRHA